MALSNPPSFALAIKAAMRRLIDACGGQESAILITGMPIKRHQAISEYGDASHPGHARADVIALMEADCGRPIVTEVLAKATHHVLVPLPDVMRSRNPLGRITGEAMKETSEVFARLGGFLSDGTLSRTEGAHLDREIDEAIVKLLALRAQVDFEAGGGE